MTQTSLDLRERVKQDLFLAPSSPASLLSPPVQVGLSLLYSFASIMRVLVPACGRSTTLYHLLLILSWFPKGYWNAPCGCLIPVGLLPVFQAVPCSWATAGGPMLGCYTLYISIPRPHDSYIRTITDFTKMKFLPSFLTDASVWVKIKSKNK